MKQTVEDHIASFGGKHVKEPASQIKELEIGFASPKILILFIFFINKKIIFSRALIIRHLPFTISKFEEKEFVFTDKGIQLTPGEEVPEPGGYQTLEKILSQYSDRTSPTRIKIVVCGGDKTISGIAWAYSILRNTKPDQFKLLEMSFYILPTGDKNHFANYVSLYDQWYGRQILLATRSVMWVLPGFTKHSFQEKSRTDAGGTVVYPPTSASSTAAPAKSDAVTGVPPSLFLRNTLDHYLRQGNVRLGVKIYFAEIWALTTPGSNVSTRKTIPFLRSVEIGITAFTTVLQVGLPCFRASHPVLTSPLSSCRGPKILPKSQRGAA